MHVKYAQVEYVKAGEFKQAVLTRNSASEKTEKPDHQNPQAQVTMWPLPESALSTILRNHADKRIEASLDTDSDKIILKGALSSLKEILAAKDFLAQTGKKYAKLIHVQIDMEGSPVYNDRKLHFVFDKDSGFFVLKSGHSDHALLREYFDGDDPINALFQSGVASETESIPQPVFAWNAIRMPSGGANVGNSDASLLEPLPSPRQEGEDAPVRVPPALIAPVIPDSLSPFPGIPNHAPTASGIDEQLTGAGLAFMLDAGGNFTDADNDTLIYSAALQGGGALPGWLGFNTATGQFLGTAGMGNLGNITVTVTARDGLASASTSFVIGVYNYAMIGTIHDDTLVGGSVFGGPGNDQVGGTVGNDTLAGGIGGDTLYGGDGDDSLDGGDGNDFLYGWIGNDTLIGGAGNDQLAGEDGNDTLIGDNGVDTLYGGAGNDLLQGGGDEDALYGWTGNDTLYGGAGNDAIYGEADDDTLYGDDGQDTLTGGAGNDLIFGGSGDDTVYAATDDDTIYGGAGNDFLLGDEGNDHLYGEADNDFLYGWIGNDTLEGGAGNDFLSGEDHMDSLYGGNGDDTLFGGNDNDRLEGQDGDDRLEGDAGNDSLYGGDGSDRYIGGANADIFIIDHFNDDGDLDRIVDMGTGGDALAFEDDYYVFTSAFSIGGFAGGTFIGSGGSTFLYDTTDGQVWYDADADGGGTAILVALIENFAGYAFSPSDFITW